MKLAIITDIHSNLIGLELAIKDAINNKVDKFIFLGDYITDGNNDNEVLELVKKYADYAVIGNREKYMFNYNDSKKEYANYKPIAHSYNNLTKENFDYIKSLPDELSININNYKLLLIHGDKYTNQTNDMQSILMQVIKENDFDICLFGHVHNHLNIKYGNHYFITPGSIGQPTDTSSYKYCILDLSNEVKVELKEFDVKDTFNELTNQYLNSDYYKENTVWASLILKTIETGKDHCTPFLKLFNNNIKNIEISNVNEFNQYWEKSYKEFISNFNNNLK